MRSLGRRDFFLKALGKISGRGVRGSDWYFQAWQIDETVMRLQACQIDETVMRLSLQQGHSAQFFMDCLGCFCVTTADWGRCDSNPMAFKAWNAHHLVHNRKRLPTSGLKHDQKCQLNFLWDWYISECITSFHLVTYAFSHPIRIYSEHLFCARNYAWNQDIEIKHRVTVLHMVRTGEGGRHDTVWQR